MISKSFFKNVVSKKGKKIGDEGIGELVEILKGEIEVLISKAVRKADIDGRKVLRKGDFEG